jgi:hypothetical protein
MFLKKSLVFSFAALLLLASAARTAEKANPGKEKEFVFKVVERNSKAIALLSETSTTSPNSGCRSSRPRS